MGKRAARNLTLEEKELVGTYERKSGAYTLRYVLLEDGIVESYSNDFGPIRPAPDFVRGKMKWSIVDNEIHIRNLFNFVYVWRLNPDNSIAKIAYIGDGKRKELTKEQQAITFKKIN